MTVSPHTPETPRPVVARPEEQVHRLPGRLSHLAKTMGYGRPNPIGTGWVFARSEIDAARAEAARRANERARSYRNRTERPSSRHIPSDLALLDVVRSDPMDEVERVLFRVALDLTLLGAELHRAAQLMKAKRLEWEAHLVREARKGH